MGNKINPISLRLQADRRWRSRWFATRDYKALLKEDLHIRKIVGQNLGFRASVAQVEIERNTGEVIVTIYTAKPGVVIGRGGSGTEALKQALAKVVTGKLRINIEEIRQPDLEAQLVANNIASALERRMPFRRILKSTVENSMKAGALGVKATVSGRLNGADMARTETVAQGSIPLHTIRAKISYATADAKTTFGIIGVKVWVYTGEND
ncbi:30S ribosomal protein S3 [Candidatus Saccharibacteria bacterium]|nr:30S ribosomal protein S3 [Candidatus Saccharibacteria bacterium]